MSWSSSSSLYFQMHIQTGLYVVIHRAQFTGRILEERSANFVFVTQREAYEGEDYRK